MHLPFLDTLGSVEWLDIHAEGLKKLLPVTWTHVGNVSLLKIGFGFKLLGVDWRSEEQLTEAIVYLEKIKLLQRDGLLIRVNPHFTFGRLED